LSLRHRRDRGKQLVFEFAADRSADLLGDPARWSRRCDVAVPNWDLSDITVLVDLAWGSKTRSTFMNFLVAGGLLLSTSLSTISLVPSGFL
jgi:hypothetical protein